MATRNLAVLGVPYDGIGVTPEEENPPEAIRRAGLVEKLEKRAVSVADRGDVSIGRFDGRRDETTHILNQQAWIETSQNLSAALGEILRTDAFPVVLGGDCGILLGIVGACRQQSLGVGLVMLDGHADFRSPMSSPSGEAADIPLWVLTGRGPAEVGDLYGPSPLLCDDAIVVYGFREPDMIHESSIAAFDRRQMAALGIDVSVDTGLAPLLRQDLNLWLHFDVDVIDPADMPAVRFPEPGGLSMNDTRRFLRLLRDTERLMGLSLACYHPNLDSDGRSARHLVDLIADTLA